MGSESMAMSLGARGLPRAVVDDVYFAPVHINAGGTTYTTTLTTLTKYPNSKLAKLFNGTLAITVDPVNRHYFLDIDGSVFNHILNFLRYDKLVLPEDFNQRSLLKEQVQFFEFEEMLAALTASEDDQRSGEGEMKTSGSGKGEMMTVGSGEGEMMTVGSGEGETGSVCDVVIVDVNFSDSWWYPNYRHAISPKSMLFHSTAELSLNDPTSNNVSVKVLESDFGYCLFYNVPQIDTTHYSKHHMMLYLAHFSKQLMDKDFRPIMEIDRSNPVELFHTFLFTRVKKIKQ